MTAFHLHLDFIPIHTARVIHSVVVAMTLFNTWRAVNSLPIFKVTAHSHFDLQSMNHFVARLSSCYILPQVVRKLLWLCALLK